MRPWWGQSQSCHASHELGTSRHRTGVTTSEGPDLVPAECVSREVKRLDWLLASEKFRNHAELDRSSVKTCNFVCRTTVTGQPRSPPGPTCCTLAWHIDLRSAPSTVPASCFSHNSNPAYAAASASARHLQAANTWSRPGQQQPGPSHPYQVQVVLYYPRHHSSSKKVAASIALLCHTFTVLLFPLHINKQRVSQQNIAGSTNIQAGALNYKTRLTATNSTSPQKNILDYFGTTSHMDSKYQASSGTSLQSSTASSGPQVMLKHAGEQFQFQSDEWLNVRWLSKMGPP